MDDEELVRLGMLLKLGYDAALTEDGEQALACYKEAREVGTGFEAVILDLTVRGGMGGLECVSHLLKIDPAVKAIVSSGYCDDAVLCNCRNFGFKNIITKPYELADLSSVLHSVINGL